MAILSLNGDRYVGCLYTVTVALFGAASNPVNIRLAPPEIAHRLVNWGAAVLLVDDTLASHAIDVVQLAGDVERRGAA